MNFKYIEKITNKEVKVIKTFKTKTVPLICSKEDYEYLSKCNAETARVWNECIRLHKELWTNEKKYVDRKYLQDRIKGSFSNILPAHAMQITTVKYLTSLSNTRKARKVGRNDVRYSYKQKKFYNTIWDKALFNIKYEDNTILLATPNNKVDGKRVIRKIKLHAKDIPQNLRRIELKYDNGFKLALVYEEEIEVKKTKSKNIASIDMGEIHAITSIDKKGNSLIITGRELRSINRYYNKESKKLYKKLSKCTKGSNNYKKYRKTLNKLKYKTKNKKLNCYHKISKMYVDWCLQYKISKVIIGDLSNFNLNLKNKKNKKGQMQRLVQRGHGELLYYLEYKLKNKLIDIEYIPEHYTSQTCPNCGKRNKMNNRNYICKHCGFKLHRDIVGAVNILNKYDNNVKILKVRSFKYLQV